MLTFHAQLSTQRMNISPDALPGMWEAAHEAASRTGNFPKDLSGVTVVGHGGKDNYVRRLWLRLVREVAAQIPREKGWGAFYWTNGAPLDLILETVQKGELPSNLEGVILIGDSVRFLDANIHCFVAIVPRDTDAYKAKIFRSTQNDAMAQALFETYNASSGVRTVLLAATDGESRREVLRRDGAQRIYPFNFVIDEDPEEAPKSTSRLRQIGH
jgi:hypothetical protein